MSDFERIADLERRRERFLARREARLDATILVVSAVQAIDDEIVRLSRRLRDRLYARTDGRPENPSSR